ncbi:hypothetical protein VTL71DRAFT_6227 [Oculimacula yallundae]|uniref:Uncharacterized protein n=1 Tax=Oculimacula yallundae TaxID=86028 RepID=A0ABR4BZX0_9HELO
MELRQMPFTQRQPSVLTSLPPPTTTEIFPSSKSMTTQMDRQDSGFAEKEKFQDSNETTQSVSATNSRRTSTSSSTKRLSSPSNRDPTATRPKRRTTNSSSSSSTTRPTTKRTSRSSNTTAHRSSNSISRPSLSSRHTVPYTQQIQQSQQPYQFFQFPALGDSSPQSKTTTASSSQRPQSPSPPTTLSPPPPPPTVQYWTSDSTRRLEYAAIDAASKGVRGFFIKLIPDCILPPSTRRTKFHNKEEDGESDAGSVRRYRLVLPEEKESCEVLRAMRGDGDGSGRARAPGRGRGRGMLRRWTSFGKRGAASSAD